MTATAVPAAPAAPDFCATTPPALTARPVQRRRVQQLAACTLALALTACGGGGDAASPTPAPAPPAAPAVAGTLLSSAQVNTLGVTAITQALSMSESKVKTGVTPRYDVVSHRITYRTTDKDGALVDASGLISVPVKAAGTSSPVLSYQHATTFHDDQAPSNKVEAVEPPIVLASLGYIVVSPDYVGFGASKGLVHPYLTATPTARAVVDMLSAADTWRQQKAVSDNGQLFLAGYSEGGYATMAAHRVIHQEGGARKAQLLASIPGAGPYDVQVTLDEQLDRISTLVPALGRLLEPGRLARLSESVRNELRDLLLGQLVPDDGDVAYQSLFLDRYLADDQAGIAAYHSVHMGWAPTVPVYLFHGRGDLTVPYEASVSARDTLKAAGGTDVTLTDCTTPNFGHLDCVPEYFRFAVQRMGMLARNL